MMKPFTEGTPPPARFNAGERAFYNGKYQAILKDAGGMVILTIRREDRRPVTDWRDVQWIKNQLLGPEVEAVQLFPAESRLVDTSNQFYLYASKQEGYRFPFGFTERRVAEGISVKLENCAPSQQRPFADHVRPADLKESEELLAQELREVGIEPL
ncbi:MAG TPA: hypothetical protein VK789_28130 [Bryobacteraceae bacterium]|nr:hypothetical protein [Bryobacteraceae bacterium]